MYARKQHIRQSVKGFIHSSQDGTQKDNSSHSKYQPKYVAVPLSDFTTEIVTQYNYIT